MQLLLHLLGHCLIYFILAMTIIFISDLHLSVDKPKITACFFKFLNEEAINCSALYILGDLFEAWIGDDDKTLLHDEVAIELSKLKQKGVALYFIHGNRDFLIGKQYAERAGFTLLDEAEVIDLFGTPTLIMHGDTLCIQDINYQAFRKKVHSPYLQWLFRRLPLFIRKKIGLALRKGSQEDQAHKSIEMMDVDQKEVSRIMGHYKVTQLIHGHTHHPGIHSVKFGTRQGTRIVLGDWYEQGSILVCNTKGYELQTRQF